MKLVMVFSTVCIASPIQAIGDFMGNSLHVEWLTGVPPHTYVVYRMPYDVVVGDHVEIPFIRGGEFDIDIGDTWILFSNFNIAPGDSVVFGDLPGFDFFNGFRFYDSAAVLPPFSSLAINDVTNMAGLDASRVWFDADNVYVNFAGLPATHDTVIRLDVGFVPEPYSAILLGLGALMLRRKVR